MSYKSNGMLSVKLKEPAIETKSKKCRCVLHHQLHLQNYLLSEERDVTLRTLCSVYFFVFSLSAQNCGLKYWTLITHEAFCLNN